MIAEFADEPYLGDGLIVPFYAVPSAGRPLANLPFKDDETSTERNNLDPDGKAKAPPPGGILIVATVSGLSGAVMGLLLGGYVTTSLGVLIGSSLGIAVGIWASRLGN